MNGELKGFITLMGNEVAALFLSPFPQGKGMGNALMIKATMLHENLEVEVFKVNEKGRDFYSKCGFEYLNEAFHEPTNQAVLRLKFTPNK